MSSAQTNSSIGKVVVVWSAHGSVGRTSLLASVACELAKQGKSVLIIDADTHAPSMVQTFGFDQNFAGLSAAMRALDQGRLADETFDRLLLDFELQKLSIKLLAGLTIVDRWPEIGFEKIRELIDLARSKFDFVLIDIAAGIETKVVDARMQSERNAAALGALSKANQIIAICQADVVGINRFVWAMHSLRALGLEADIRVLVNRLNQSTGGRRVAAEVASSLKTLAEVEVDGFIEEDILAFGKALADGVPMPLVGRNSSAKQAIRTFALTHLLAMRSKGSVAKLG
ncbi:MAG: hypothetical protein RL149_990 [Actinomycetota bacterium]